LKGTLSGKTVLVTGATGCAGGRLVERLVTVEGAHVRALVRNPARAARIARFPVELVCGDVLDVPSLERAVQGCEVVFHCAYGSGGTEAQRRQVTVEGTERTLQAASQASVSRFVHVSTVVVHGYGPRQLEMTELASYASQGQPEYARSKITAEKLVFKFHREHGLPVAVLRPCLIYGPWSAWWTVATVERIKSGRLALVEEGQGICNSIYVDDVVSAMILAATHPQAIGQAFFVAGQTTTWKTFFEYYAHMVGVESLPSWTKEAWHAAWRRQRRADTLAGRLISALGSASFRGQLHQLPLVGSMYSKLIKAIPRQARAFVVTRAEHMRQVQQTPPALPNEFEMREQTSPCVYSTQKARQLLGFESRFSLEKGMALTESWLRYMSII
jgi:nucleoside-diphosphate-sugar epimerase